jgi:hypothetical protein
MSTITINNLYNRNAATYGLILADTQGNIIDDSVIKTQHTYNNITPGFYDVWSYNADTQNFSERLAGITVSASPPIINHLTIVGFNTAVISGSNSDILTVASRRALGRLRGGMGNTIANTSPGSLPSLNPGSMLLGFILFVFLIFLVIFVVL